VVGINVFRFIYGFIGNFPNRREMFVVVAEKWSPEKIVFKAHLRCFEWESQRHKATLLEMALRRSKNVRFSARFSVLNVFFMDWLYRIQESVKESHAHKLPGEVKPSNFDSSLSSYYDSY